MSKVSFYVSPEDRRLIEKIVERAFELRSDFSDHTDRLCMEMDLAATHANGCPMDFERLAEADSFNLIHDVVGIFNHIDRTTGKLTGCFLPRFARPEQDEIGVAS